MKRIYLEDSYRRDFEATVQSASTGRIILDQTAFYPQSGGQPSDIGQLHREGDAFDVLRAEPIDDQIGHILDKEDLVPGDKVYGEINWDRGNKDVKVGEQREVQ